jgi:predicted transglutaminase-like cysteine proteinase
VALLLVLPTLLFALHVDFSPGLSRYLEDKWDDDAPERALGWQQLIHKQEKLAVTLANPERAERSSIGADNTFWNRIPYFRDMVHWGVEDYWATPLEALGSNGADCEDYAIGKYFTLKELGVPAQKLRITYVRALKWNETHMVLAYYPEPDADPYILDNLVPDILPPTPRSGTGV